MKIKEEVEYVIHSFNKYFSAFSFGCWEYSNEQNRQKFLFSGGVGLKNEHTGL